MRAPIDRTTTELSDGLLDELCALTGTSGSDYFANRGANAIRYLSQATHFDIVFSFVVGRFYLDRVGVI